MSELRWILLGLGALFCIGLWVWETRRRRQASGSLREFDSDEVRISSHFARLRPREARLEPTLGETVSVQDGAPDFDEPPSEAVALEVDGPEEDPDSQPRAGEAAGSAEATDMPPDEIVSLRVLAPAQKPFEGRELIKALHAAGLEHGKFSIFHKYDIDGRTLFSVASLVEPGSFDLQRVDGQPFRGVTFFTLKKGSGEAGILAMKLAAQDLAGRLQGTVQDNGRA